LYITLPRQRSGKLVSRSSQASRPFFRKMYLLRRNELHRAALPHFYKNLPTGTPKLTRVALVSRHSTSRPGVPQVELRTLVDDATRTPSTASHLLTNEDKAPDETYVATAFEPYSRQNLTSAYTKSIRVYLMRTYGHINERLFHFFKERLRIHGLIRSRPEKLFDILTRLPSTLTSAFPKTPWRTA